MMRMKGGGWEGEEEQDSEGPVKGFVGVFFVGGFYAN